MSGLPKNTVNQHSINVNDPRVQAYLEERDELRAAGDAHFYVDLDGKVFQNMRTND